jgi:hypothetical protein
MVIDPGEIGSSQNWSLKNISSHNAAAPPVEGAVAAGRWAGLDAWRTTPSPPLKLLLRHVFPDTRHGSGRYLRTESRIGPG